MEYGMRNRVRMWCCCSVRLHIIDVATIEDGTTSTVLFGYDLHISTGQISGLRGLYR